MKRMTKILVASGFILSLVITACNRNHRPRNVPGNISKAVLLSSKEIPFQTLEKLTNQHSLLPSRIYAMMHAAMDTAATAENHLQPINDCN